MTKSTMWTGAVGLAQAIPTESRSDSSPDRSWTGWTAGSSICSRPAGKPCVRSSFTPGLPRTPSCRQAFWGWSQTDHCSSPAAARLGSSLIPHLLPKHQLAAGLALRRIAFQGAMLVGPALGGLRRGRAGSRRLLPGRRPHLHCRALRRVRPAADEPRRRAARPGLRGVLDGLAFLGRTPVIRGALLTDLATTVLSMPISLFPLINAERFGGSPPHSRTVPHSHSRRRGSSIFFFGTFTRLPRPGLVMLGGSATWAAALTFFGMSPDPWVQLAFLVIAGAADRLRRIPEHRGPDAHPPRTTRPGQRR